MIDFFVRSEWWLFKTMRRIRLKNRRPTIIADNCNAGIIYHDLGLPFLSPTINLYFLPADYLKFLQNLQHYLQVEPKETMDTSVAWPVGMLDDVKVYFMHYKSFAEAREKWISRTARIDFDNLFVLMSEKNGCTYEQMQTFDAMPFQHKTLLVHKPYPEFKSSVCLPGFENQSQLGVVTDFKPGLLRRRYLDSFDYVSFLNVVARQDIEKTKANQ